MAAFDALVYLLHGRLAVLTTAGTTPEHEALRKEGREKLGREASGAEITTECNRGAPTFAPLLLTDIKNLKPQTGKLSSKPSRVFRGLLAASSLALVALKARCKEKVAVGQMKPNSENPGPISQGSEVSNLEIYIPPGGNRSINQ